MKLIQMTEKIITMCKMYDIAKKEEIDVNVYETVAFEGYGICAKKENSDNANKCFIEYNEETKKYIYIIVKNYEIIEEWEE